MSRFLTVVAAVLMALGFTVPLATAAQAACTTYYVSSSSGSDSNSGCSSSAPWQTLTNVNDTTFAAGDQILFADGGSWTGELHPLGSGSSGDPITVSSYGSGAAPIIAGGGAAAAVYLDDQQYWTIENLDITNTASSAAVRSGIQVENDTSGILDGIDLIDNDIHNVLGYWSTSENEQPTTSSGIAFNLSDSYSTNGWDGVLISGNTLTDDDAGGIYLGSLAGTGHDIYTSNVVIENNTLTDMGGNDVVCVYCDDPIVQYNVAADNGYRYSGAGFWMALNNGGQWQYNDISGQWRALWDGMAFDIDHDNNGTILQYNYTHDNPYGFMEFCCSSTFGSENSVVRYNISQNDGVLTQNTWLSGILPTGTTQIYNNTIYMGPGDNGAVTAGTVSGGNATLTNNLIVDDGTGGYSSTGTWSHNLFYGTDTSTLPSDSSAVTSNPLLVSPGGAGASLSSAAAYELQPGSPAIGAGTLVSDNGGQDFFGNTVSSTAAPDIGAYGGSGVTPTATEEGAFWPLDEGSGSTAYDNTNDHNTGTLEAGASWTTGNNESYAVALDGASNSYVDVATPAINTAGSYSVAAWVKLNSLSGNQTFASIDGTNISPFYLQLESGTFAFTLRSSDSTSSTATIVSGGSPSTGTWYHLLGVYNASTDKAYLYVNGSLANSATFSSPWQATGHTAIGRALWNGNNVDFVNGDIEDVRMYDTALTAQDAIALGTGATAYYPFNEGSGSTDANLIQTSAPADLVKDATWYGSAHGSDANALALDGTFGTSANIPAAVIDTGSSYTVAAWVKFNSVSGSNQTFVSLDGGIISPFYLQLTGGDLAMTVRSSNSISSTATSATGPAATAGTWYHVVGVVNTSADTVSLYVNGTLESSKSFSSPWTAVGTTEIGSAMWDYNQVDWTNGDIDDVVFYDKALTASQIAALASA